MNWQRTSPRTGLRRLCGFLRLPSRRFEHWQATRNMGQFCPTESRHPPASAALAHLRIPEAFDSLSPDFRGSGDSASLLRYAGLGVADLAERLTQTDDATTRYAGSAQPLCGGHRPGHDQLGRRRSSIRAAERVGGADVRRAAAGGAGTGGSPRDAAFVPLSRGAAGSLQPGHCGCRGNRSEADYVVGTLAQTHGEVGAGPADHVGQELALPCRRRSHGGAAALARRGRRAAHLARRGQQPLSGPHPRGVEPSLSASIRWSSRTSCSRCRRRSTKWPAS